MRRYETITIIDPDLSDEERAQVLERTTNLIPKEGGFLIMLDDWGNRKLAYEIKKKVRGYYVRIDYCGMGSLVNEMERFFRIDDKILKFMTVLLEKDADVENIKEEMAEAKAEAETKAKAEAEAKSEAETKAKAEAEAKSEAEAKAEAETKAKAEAAMEKAEEVEKEADASDETPDKDDESDTDHIPLDSPETETVETETTETKINKEEQ